MKELNKIWSKHHKAILIVLAVIVFVVIIWTVAKKMGQKKAPVTYDLTNPTTGQQVQFNPGVLTDQLYNDMKPHSFWSFQGWTGRNLSPYQEWLKLWDAQFKAVADDWRIRYYSLSGNKTIFEKLAGEVDYTFTIGGNSFASLRDQILARARNLNIY